MASLRPPSLDTCYAQWHVQQRDISPHSSRSFLSRWLLKKAGRLLLSFPGPFSSRFLRSPPGFQLTLSPGDAHIHGRPRGPCQSAPKADVAKQIIFKRCHDIITNSRIKGTRNAESAGGDSMPAGPLPGGEIPRQPLRSCNTRTRLLAAPQTDEHGR